MKPWIYHPSPELPLTRHARLSVFPREPDMTRSLLRMAWTLGMRLFLRIYFRLRIRGREKLPDVPFLMVANHSSHLDAVALSTVVPVRALNHTFAAAAHDYFFTSFLRASFAAVFINAVPFHRDRKAKQSLELCADLLSASDNVLIMFPEGTRSTTGEIQPFRRGVGELVAGTPRKVVPVYLDGAFRAWPKGNVFPKPRTVTIHIGDPVEFGDFTADKEGCSLIARELETMVRKLQPHRQS
jgi:1-acyl-sn-glycerol-3-phosphate acyltransferase